MRELKENALLWLYGTRCDAAVDAIRDADTYTLRCLLQRMEPGNIAISFNYDTVVERLAKRFGVTLRHCSGAPRDFVKFAKPHGSASWPLHIPPSVVMEGEPRLDSLAEDMKNEPLVLGAVPIKSELLREVQLCYNAPQVSEIVMHHWRSVVEAVRDAEELVVAGYSFPKEDQYGRFLFSQAKRMRSRPLKRIEFYSLESWDGEAILEVFGCKDTEVVWKGPVKSPGKST